MIDSYNPVILYQWPCINIQNATHGQNLQMVEVNVVSVIMITSDYIKLVTVAKQSEAFTVCTRLEAGFMGPNLTQGMDVWYVYVFILCLCVVLCLGRGLATSQSLVQGVLQSVKWPKRKKKKTISTPQSIRGTD
jgi:hypothetical protein